MSLPARLAIYQQIEAIRKRPLIVYITSPRQGANGSMASDVVSEFHAQLQRLPPEATELDLMIVSNGGDPTVAWRIVSLIRERVKQFFVLIPQAAFSAATLVALGADEIYMHPFGNLGPVDPQIAAPRRNPRDGQIQLEVMSPQDLNAFLQFAQSEVKANSEDAKVESLKLLCAEVGAVQLGRTARSAQLMASMSERLLLLHTKDKPDHAKQIVESLNKKYFHHGYPISRSEAKELGLKIGDAVPAVNDLIWAAWTDFEQEYRFKEPFNPLQLMVANPQCLPLFMGTIQGPSTFLPIQVNMQVPAMQIPSIDYKLVHACVESPRWVTQFMTEGKIIASRKPDMNMNLVMEQVRASWREVGQPNQQAQA